MWECGWPLLMDQSYGSIFCYQQGSITLKSKSLYFSLVGASLRGNTDIVACSLDLLTTKTRNPLAGLPIEVWVFKQAAYV